MLINIRDLDNKLSSNFKKLLVTAISMLFIAILGGVITFFVSYNIGHVIVLAAVLVGNLCLVTCAVLRILGKHLKNETEFK
jgi:hypothetical protein